MVRYRREDECWVRGMRDLSSYFDRGLPNPATLCIHLRRCRADWNRRAEESTPNIEPHPRVNKQAAEKCGFWKGYAVGESFEIRAMV